MVLKKTSEMIAISTRLSQSATDAFTQKQVSLQLNPLDNEVFVVTAIKMDLGNLNLDTTGGQYLNTYLMASVTAQSQAAVGVISQNNCIAAAARRVNYAADGQGSPFATIFFEDGPIDNPESMLDRIGIIATDDFFVQIDSERLLTPSHVDVRVYGYRAKADAATYAALVQSEVLSA